MRGLASWGVLALAPFLFLPASAAAQPPVGDSSPEVLAAARRTDLDALMERVLANRAQAWRRLQEYLLAERETFRLQGPDGAPVSGFAREYLWVARDGRAVRSPVRINGVAVGDEDRRRAEVDWQREDDERAARSEGRRADAAVASPDVAATAIGREPRFISEVQFLRFRFEPGNYFFVGREVLADREVLRIEYYPRRLFGDDDPIERAFNKVSLVTLWVDPTVDQIVRYTFDNVDFNFLPGRSLARVDAAKATMTMGQPFTGVWLPESLVVEGALTLANGTYRAEYARRFSDYRQADVQVRFRVKDDK